MTISAIRCINDDGIIRLRLSKERDILRPNLYAVIRKYMKNINIFIGKRVNYKGYDVTIKSDIHLQNQIFKIETDNKDIYEELKYRHILINDNYIRLDSSIKVSTIKDIPEINLINSVNDILDKYSKKYFTTSTKYVDIILWVDINNIVKEIINIIDTISEEDGELAIIESVS